MVLPRVARWIEKPKVPSKSWVLQMQAQTLTCSLSAHGVFINSNARRYSVVWFLFNSGLWPSARCALSPVAGCLWAGISGAISAAEELALEDRIIDILSLRCWSFQGLASRVRLSQRIFRPAKTSVQTTPLPMNEEKGLSYWKRNSDRSWLQQVTLSRYINPNP